jgi:hypothetical protein
LVSASPNSRPTQQTKQNLQPSLALFLAHKGLSVEEFVDLSPLAPVDASAAPQPLRCPGITSDNSTAALALQFLAQLDSIWPANPLPYSKDLESLAWTVSSKKVGLSIAYTLTNLAFAQTRKISNAEMGGRLAAALKSATAPSWGLLLAAGLHLRLAGKAQEAFVCFMHAAVLSPRGHLDLVFANIAAMLLPVNVRLPLE